MKMIIVNDKHSKCFGQIGYIRYEWWFFLRLLEYMLSFVELQLITPEGLYVGWNSQNENINA